MTLLLCRRFVRGWLSWVVVVVVVVAVTAVVVVNSVVMFVVAVFVVVLIVMSTGFTKMPPMLKDCIQLFQINFCRIGFLSFLVAVFLLPQRGHLFCFF